MEMYVKKKMFYVVLSFARLLYWLTVVLKVLEFFQNPNVALQKQTNQPADGNKDMAATSVKCKNWLLD